MKPFLPKSDMPGWREISVVLPPQTINFYAWQDMLSQRKYLRQCQSKKGSSLFHVVLVAFISLQSRKQKQFFGLVFFSDPLCLHNSSVICGNTPPPTGWKSQRLHLGRQGYKQNLFNANFNAQLTLTFKTFKLLLTYDQNYGQKTLQIPLIE